MGVVGVALTGLGKQRERESSGQPGILLQPSQVSLRTAAAFPFPSALSHITAGPPNFPIRPAWMDICNCFQYQEQGWEGWHL